MKIKPKNIPKKPGVYIFKGQNAEILYIGKANNLHKRISSYFKGGQKQLELKTKKMVHAAKNIEYIITDNQTEALILENILIKKHKPRYNVKLRDDKNYQYIALDNNAQIPQIYPLRNRYKDQKGKQIKLYGPYTSGKKVRSTLRLIKKIFPVCTAKKVGNRPCFNFQLHRCPGVCIGKISVKEYKILFKQIELFLQGHTSLVKKNLKKQMKSAASHKKFEKAALLRDQLEALTMLSQDQKIISTKNVNRDYISCYQESGAAAVNLFKVREGRLIDREIFILEDLNTAMPKKSILSLFIQRFYTQHSDLPKKIYVEEIPEEASSLLPFLHKKASELNLRYKPVLHQPKRGESKKLIALGVKNAQDYLLKKIIGKAKDKKRIENSLNELQKIMGLPKKPQRIEGFDISNIQGTNAVGSLVVFKNGKPEKSQYRKFRIRTKTTPDDYTMIKEIVERRLRNDWPKPDLILIDGGRGQLNTALKVLKEKNWKTKIISIAKSGDRSGASDKIFVPKKEEPLDLKSNNPALQLLQNVRDEAHRFAITYHKKLRSKGLLSGE